MMESELFAANEYCSTCGDSGINYLFECNAGGGTPGSVYQETNGREGLQTRGGWGYRADKELTDWDWSHYYACNEKHTASSTDDFLNGYYLPNNNSRNAKQVIIWRGQNGDDIHCTTKLNKDEWEVQRS